MDGNRGGTLGHEPAKAAAAGIRGAAHDLHGAADHWEHLQDEDYYSQPGLLFRLLRPDQQEVLLGNTARALGDAPREIKIRHIGNCLKADPAYGKGMADALAISLDEVSR